MALTKLAAARLRLLTKQPYLSRALLSMRVVETSSVPVAAVDGYGRLYIGPGFEEAADPKAGAAILAHECWHVLRHHHSRVDGMEPHRANMAADLEINDDDPGGESGLPAWALRPAGYGLPDGLTMERYYSLLREKNVGNVVEIVIDLLGNGHAAVRQADQGGVDRLTDTELKAAAAEVARAIKSRPGSSPGDREWAEGELVPSKVPWQRALAATIARTVAPRGYPQATYSRPPRRRPAAGVVMPGTVRHRADIAVVLDTSGSMGSGRGSELVAALSEVGGILRVAGQVRLLPCDTRAVSAQTIHRATGAKLIGGGGTEMGAGIAAADGLRPRPDLIVVLTDGMTGWPASGPKTPVLVCVVSKADWVIPVPIWAQRIDVEKT